MTKADEAWREAVDNGPEPGTDWRHHEGNTYTTMGPAIIESTLEAAVIYKSRTDGRVWVRSLTSWFGKTEDGTTRFAPMEQ